MKMVPLGKVIARSGAKAGERSKLPVYSVTKYDGFVRSRDYFKKRVFSEDLSGYKVVERGEFAYATIHLDEGSIGIAPESSLISPMYTVFSVDESRVYGPYLLRYLKSPQAIHSYSILGNGAVHRRKAVALSSISRLSVPLPPLDEQRRLAAILDQADAIRAKRRQLLARLDDLSQSAFGNLFPIDPGNLGNIGDLARYVAYGTSSKAGEAGEWPVLRMGNITDGGRLELGDLKYMDLAQEDIVKYTVSRGDLVFNRTNSVEKVGKAAVLRGDDKFALAGYNIRVRFEYGELAEFVSAYLRSPYGVASRRKAAKAAVNQANISASGMRRIPIPIPDREDVIEFAMQVGAIEDQRDTIQRALAADDELFASLQSRAFRGEL